MSLAEDDFPRGTLPASSPRSTTNSTMKFPRVLRRSSAIDNGTESHKERDGRRTSVPEPDRRSSLSSLPLRLRRKKTQVHVEQTKEEVEAATRLGDLFFSLPSEILTQIFTHFSLQDIYALRQTSRTFNTILNYNAIPLTRRVLADFFPESAPTQLLYPLQPTSQAANTTTSTTQNSLSYLLPLIRRYYNHQIHLTHLLSFVQMKIYMTRTATRVLSVHDNRQRLLAAFHRPSWFLTHFLEQYRDILIHSHPKHILSTPPPPTSTSTSPPTSTSTCPDCLTHARQIISIYPAEDILPTYHFYQLTLQHLQIATRAPSSAGPIERRLRGWDKSRSLTEEMLSIFVLLGGMEEMKKVAMMQGSYGSRSGFVVDFVTRVREAVAVNEILRESAVNARGAGGGGYGCGDLEGEGRAGIRRALEPAWGLLTQHHIASLPLDLGGFFDEVWRERVVECAVEGELVGEPYPWLQRVMSGSGLEFGQARYPDLPMTFGASPV